MNTFKCVCCPALMWCGFACTARLLSMLAPSLLIAKRMEGEKNKWPTRERWCCCEFGRISEEPINNFSVDCVWLCTCMTWWTVNHWWLISSLLLSVWGREECVSGLLGSDLRDNLNPTLVLGARHYVVLLNLTKCGGGVGGSWLQQQVQFSQIFNVKYVVFMLGTHL